MLVSSYRLVGISGISNVRKKCVAASVKLCFEIPGAPTRRFLYVRVLLASKPHLAVLASVFIGDITIPSLSVAVVPDIIVVS
jgi:hypothetical protein